MKVDVMQVLSLIGAVLILAGYAGQQYAGLRGDSLGYGVLNLAGSALLAASAVTPLNGGVLFVESTWAALSLGIVYRALAGKRAGRTEPTPGPPAPGGPIP